VLRARGVVTAAGRALADHDAFLLDAGRPALTTMRALARTAETPGIRSSLAVAQTDSHDRRQEHAQTNPPRHAYCLAAR